MFGICMHQLYRGNKEQRLMLVQSMLCLRILGVSFHVKILKIKHLRFNLVQIVAIIEKANALLKYTNLEK